MPKIREPKPEEEVKKPYDPMAKIEDTDDEETVVDVKAEESETQPETKGEEDGSKDAAEELRQQIEALKRSEEAARREAETARRERAEALRQAEERSDALRKEEKRRTQSEYDAISSAIAAAQAETEASKRDIRSAIADGDIDSQTSAYERLAKAQANLARLEGGKEALEESQREEQARRDAVKDQPKQAKDPMDDWPIPDNAKQWLRSHPDYLTDPRKNAKIQSLHYEILDEGHEQFSPGYFESLEIHLGMRKPHQPAPQREKEVVVSAPVSREVPSGGGQRSPSQVKLTKEEREAAAYSGISEAEYAKNKIRLEELKRNGYYTER